MPRILRTSGAATGPSIVASQASSSVSSQFTASPMPLPATRTASARGLSRRPPQVSQSA